VQYLEIDGVRMHTVGWAPATDASGIPDAAIPDAATPAAATPAAGGRQILLVHGLGANTLSWQPVGQLLADRFDAAVTAVDLIGFGRTRAPERRATIATNRDLVLGLLEQIGPATIFGNSMGGVIGTGVTARRPDLVDALVLVNPALPWGRVPPSSWVRVARYMPVMMPSLGRRTVSARARMLGPERLVDLSLGVTLHDPERLDPDLRRRLVLLAAERFAYPEAAAAYADAARTLIQEVAGDFDADLAVAAAARPTLLIHGAEDALVSVAFARAAAVRHGTVDLCVLDGVGHAPQLEAPERFMAIVERFLDEACGVPAPGHGGPSDERMEPHDGSDSRATWRTRGPGRGSAAASSASPSAPSSPS
jgi:pimeloyl-ACP methyl ester carboxylesterase